jgi:glycosyltransferase involved in cell wall biosynthesis
MMRALIVLPVFNEEVVLRDNARRLVAWCREHLADYDWQVRIADNGSTDRTAEISRALCVEDRRISFRSIPEAGRGRALSRVWTEGLGDFDIIAYMDVDLSADLPALRQLLDAIAAGAAVSYGSRFEPGSRIERSRTREATSRGYRLLARLALGFRASDIQCGFKAVSAAAWGILKDRVTHPGWFWDTELLFWAERRGLPSVAIPVHWVEHRDEKRKSTVRILPTVLGYLRDLFVMRLKLLRDRDFDAAVRVPGQEERARAERSHDQRAARPEEG